MICGKFDAHDILLLFIQVIKLWDVETGKSIFEFGEAHGEEAITCVTFDNTGRRLITGGRDGGIRLWNYNNGHCLKTMTKGIFTLYKYNSVI